MFIRNGIKSILRERGRTALFSLLIILLTLTMILSLGVLLYSKAVMAACDEAYRTIALVEYMGGEYPDPDEPDAAVRAVAETLNDDTVLSISGVNAWTSGNTEFASLEGYSRHIGTIPYRNKAVIVVNNFSDLIVQWAKLDENRVSYYVCNLNTAIYSKSGDEGIFIDILVNESGFTPEKEKSYVLNGSFVDLTGTLNSVGCYPTNGLAVFKVESFIATDEIPYVEYTSDEEIPDVFFDAAEQYRTMNNYVRVIPCRDVNDVNEFHQNELQLLEGEMPNPETPYSCVVSFDIANKLGLKIGDAFTMNELIGTENDRYMLTPSGKAQSYTVSGIIKDSYDHNGTVWAIDDNADTHLFGYLLGTVSLDNEKADEAVAELKAILPENLRITLLDQGYGNAVHVFRDVERTSTNILLICSFGTVAILMLFAFLYVGRQHVTVKIMVSMGTPSRKIATWFLSGTLVICGISAILGTVTGILLQPTVLSMISEIATQENEEILWYSETVIGVMKQTVFDPRVPTWPNLFAVPVIVVLAMLFCLWFLRTARKGGTNKRGKSKVRVPRGKTSALKLRGFGFASLSVRRGGLRSFIVPFISLVLTVIVLFLGGVYQGWQKKLDDASENMRIDGMVVSLNGRNYSNLVLSVNNLRTLMNTEGLQNVSVSFGYHYWLPEDEQGFSHGTYGREHRLDWIASQPEMVALNSLSAATQFYYVDSAITWLDGWDESALTEADYTPFRKRSDEKAEEKLIPVVCGSAFLEDHNLSLGDTFDCFVQVQFSSSTLKEIPLNVLVIGSYVQQGGKSQIFAPLACHVPVSLLEREVEKSVIDQWSSFTFGTCRFDLPSAEELGGVRQALRDQGFSYVGKASRNRTTIVLRDADFLRLTENMERNIAMGKIMFAVISLLIVLLGFIISWLMIFARKREFALMRGFGVKKWRVFSSFFLEQALLCLVGCLAGCSILLWLYEGGIAQPLSVIAYLVCYLLGATISILIIGRTNLMELLTVRE